MPSSKDVLEGRVRTKILDNGILVPSSLQVNQETLAEHEDRLALLKLRPSRREDVEGRFPQDEINDWFGAP